MEETILELKNLKKYYKKQRGIESISYKKKIIFSLQNMIFS